MTARTIFVWPLALGMASVVGLIAGLLGAGWFDIGCWIGLAAPVVVATRAWGRRR